MNTPEPLARRHQIHGVQPVLPVPDVPVAAAWFCTTLGFDIDFLHGEPPVYGRVKLGDRSWGDPVYIHLQGTGDAIVPCGETRLHVGHDIDGLHRHVLSCGAEVVEPPADQPWGLREMTLRAPGGHLLVLGAEIAAVPASEQPRAVLASFKPRPGQEGALLAVVRGHVPTLQRLGLATDRASLVMRAADGTIVEAFEWRSAAAIDAAHQHPEVLAMWKEFEAACEYTSLKDLAEAQHPFAEFEAL
jgi:quinol monooxygenase YgiN